MGVKVRVPLHMQCTILGVTCESPSVAKLTMSNKKFDDSDPSVYKDFILYVKKKRPEM